MTTKEQKALFSFTAYKKAAIRAAKELGYANGYLDKIKKAKTEEEISKILSEARRNRFND